MTDSRAKQPPPGLKKRGRRLWKQVLSTYELRLDELILLETACKTVDLLDDLEAAMDGQPLITKGSMGQERENPLLSEARQQRAHLNRTLAQLKLPDESTGAQINHQRAGGHARWARAHG
ncbi:hypothetical protein [Nocardioides caldifontis]|uniref:hypothetical protein n=1 Tax=Nocardioides caldifontis TaxID=2588938 RepID=UPI0011DFADF0|nr:hypothetical protein [Nocardioides caldifontis]